MSNDTIEAIALLALLIVSLVVAWLNGRDDPDSWFNKIDGNPRYCRRCKKKYVPTRGNQRNYCPECGRTIRKNRWKNLWKELRRGMWKAFVPWIAFIIVYWFFPQPLVFLPLWVVIFLVDRKLHWSQWEQKK